MVQSAGRGSPSGTLRKEWIVFAAYCLISLCLRFPLFFQDVIDWDESVFLLMGQSIAKGHLPYTEIWDNKPPVGFLFFAAIESVVPQSLFAVRLAGAIWIALSSFLVYRLALALMPRAAALFSGFVFSIAASLLAGSGQAVMMEHVANPFVLLALLCAMKHRPAAADCVLFGVAFAIAVFVRTNLAFAAVIMGVAFLLLNLADGWRAAIRAALWVAAGATGVIIAVLAPFLLAGQLDTFVTSVIKVPLAYSANGLGVSETALQLLGFIVPGELRGLADPRQFAVSLFWLLAVAGLILIGVHAFSRRERRSLVMTVAAVMATVVATVASRQPFEHYLIQIMPVAAVCFAYGLFHAKLLDGARAIPSYGIAAIAAIMLVFPHYNSLAERLGAGKPLYTGPNFTLAKFIAPQLRPEDTIFVSRHILLYWLLEKVPPIPIAAFPSNMFREDDIVRPLYGPAYTTEKLLADVLDRCPYIVVMSGNDKGYVRIQPFTSRIDMEYETSGRLGKTFVLQRKARAGEQPGRCGKGG